MKDEKTNDNKKNPILDWLCSPKPLIVISFLIIAFSLFAPWAFTRQHFFDNVVFDNSTGVIGDTFGIMNPIIAIAAAIITFAAFWTQYQANTEMLEENRTERKESIKLNRKQQLVNQFYEMLKIHQDNVKELKWTKKVIYERKHDIDIPSQNKSGMHIILTEAQKKAIQEKSRNVDEHEFVTDRGRYIFNFYLDEFNIIFNLVDIIYPEKDLRQKVKIAYDLFYKGSCGGVLYDLIIKVKNCLREKSTYKDFASDISNFLDGNGLKEKKDKIQSVLMDVFQRRSFFTIQTFLCGHFEKLNHYYRHLFLMVKMIAKEDEEILPYPEKRDLLRILRAQLSNKEQIMLFYNWYSGHGRQWEEDDEAGNHFFTKFRMIHNMTPYDAIPFQSMDGNTETAIINFIKYFSGKDYPEKEDIDLRQSFDLKYGTKNDPYFEFEDWYDAEDHKFNYGN